MTEVDTSDKLMTVEDLCRYLGVSKDFIYDEVRGGRLRASRIARQFRFRAADVDAFLEASAVSDSRSRPGARKTSTNRS